MYGSSSSSSSTTSPSRSPSRQLFKVVSTTSKQQQRPKATTTPSMTEETTKMISPSLSTATSSSTSTWSSSRSSPPTSAQQQQQQLETQQRRQYQQQQQQSGTSLSSYHDWPPYQRTSRTRNNNTASAASSAGVGGGKLRSTSSTTATKPISSNNAASTDADANNGSSSVRSMRSTASIMSNSINSSSNISITSGGRNDNGNGNGNATYYSDSHHANRKPKSPNLPAPIISKSPRYSRVKGIPRHSSPSPSSAGVGGTAGAGAGIVTPPPLPSSSTRSSRSIGEYHHHQQHQQQRWDVNSSNEKHGSSSNGTASASAAAVNFDFDHLQQQIQQKQHGEEQEQEEEKKENGYDDDFIVDNNNNGVISQYRQGSSDGGVSPYTAGGRSSNNGRSSHHEKHHENENEDDGDGDEDDSWRQHGKKFRAKLVLNDEEHGGNAFTLSNSCSIERYYRVADRVLDQFMNSNIAEPNEMIESFLVGNRLFKFLSVVLPTHDEYFSTDPALVAMRIKSQEQLVELLEYMEELELIIDEIEYNKYIISDLGTPKRHDDTVSTANNTTLSSVVSGSGTPMMATFEYDRSSSSSKKKEQPFSPAGSQDFQVRYNMHRGGVRTVNANVQHFDSRHSQRSLLDDSNDSVSVSQTSVAGENQSSRKAGSSRRLRFEQTVADVVNATSNNGSSSPAVVDFSHRSDTRRSSSLRMSRISSSRENTSPPDPEENASGLETPNGTDLSWANFSAAEIGDDTNLFETPKSRIDLLMEDDKNRRAHPSNQNRSSKLIVPKIRQPPQPLPRDVRQHYSFGTELVIDDSISVTPSFMSGDAPGQMLNYSLDGTIGMDGQELPKSKIEKRLEHASLVSKNNSFLSSDNYNEAQNNNNNNNRSIMLDDTEDRPSRRCFSTSNSGSGEGKYKYQDDSLDMDRSYDRDRNIGHHFRGCVKSLIN